MASPDAEDDRGNGPTGNGPTGSKLARLLRTGAFAVTAETVPPLSGEAASMVARAAPLKGAADAVNVTDGAGARSHMSALVAAAILLAEGIEPILQFTCRDRNRLALQADLMGASALGIRNILCLRGDDPSAGDQPDAKPVFDLDTRALISTAAQMRDEGVLPSGRALEAPPRLFIGVADSPLDPPPEWRPEGLRAKADCGADFVQTQFCFDPEMVARYIGRLRDEGLTERLFVLIGIGPIPSARSACWMRENLYGVEVPDAIIERLEAASEPRAEGRRICVELIQRFREIPGVAGVHIMAPHDPEAIPAIIEESGATKGRPALA